MQKLARWLGGLGLAWLAGCASSTIIEDSPPLVADAGAPHATVYFIRPEIQRTRGVADNAVSVELGRDKVLELGLGEYVRLQVQPGATDVILRSLTYMTSNPMPVEVWRSRRYDFRAGETYYVVARQHHEEFRGTYFTPERIDRRQANDLARGLKPVGELARQAPLG